MTRGDGACNDIHDKNQNFVKLFLSNMYIYIIRNQTEFTKIFFFSDIKK